MRFLNRYVIQSLVLAVGLVNPPAFSDHVHDHVHAHDQKKYAAKFNEALVVKPNQAVLQVNGIVCSFCTFGAEKNLSKLDFLDHSQFGKDGVFVDIKKGEITLALAPQGQIDLEAIYRKIKKGGYEPVFLHLRLSGSVKAENGQYYLTHQENAQMFRLIGENLDELAGRQTVVVQVHVDAEQLKSLGEGKTPGLMIDKVLE